MIKRVLFLACLPSLLWAQGESLTLDQAINYALTQNRNLKAAAFNIERSLYQLDEQKSQFKLRILPRGNASYRDGEEQLQYGLSAAQKIKWGTEFKVEALIDQQQDIDEDEVPYDGRLRFEIVQPLFRNAGTLVQNESVMQAQQNLKTAQRAFQNARSTLIIDVVSQFEDLIRLQRQEQADQAALQRFTRLIRVTEMREKQGKASRVDSLRVQLQLGETEVRLENSSEQRIRGEEAFADLLGFSPELKFNLHNSPLLEIALYDYEHCLEVAFSNRLDYAQVLQDFDDSVRGEKISRRQLWPDLNINLDYEQFSEGENHSDALKLDEGEWFVGLSAGSNLLRHRERSQLKQARTARQQVATDLEIFQFKVYRDVRAALLTYERSQSQLDLAAKNAALADRRLELAQRLFRMGRESNFTVTDAERSHQDAVNQHFQARAEASISGYRLLNALGILVDVPSELKPTDHFIDHEEQS